MRGAAEPNSGERPDVSLAAKPALALGLALHEVGTNAAKYGALSNDEGCYRNRLDRWHPMHKAVSFACAGAEERASRFTPSVRVWHSIDPKELAAEFDGEVELEYQPNGVECTSVTPRKGRSWSTGQDRPTHAAGRGPRR